MSWYASTTFWTGAAAVFTAMMAGFTGWSIVASQRQQRRALQQRYRPILVLAPADDAIPLDRSRLLKLAPTSSGATERTYIISCLLTNIGVGPALKVHLQLRVRGIEGYGISRELTPISAGASRADPDGSVRVTFQLHGGFSDASVQVSTGESWELLLEYEDVFGNCFHTIHSKNPLQPWTMCGRGPAPRGVDPAVVNAMLQAGSTGRGDGPDSPGFGP